MYYFLSDLHLGAPYFSDSRDVERRVVRFLDSIADDAEEIFLVGDILDYWYEYKYVVPRGYVRFFGKLAELSDHGIKITWLIGNHDIWIFDYIPQELGVTVVDGIIERTLAGKKFVISHGDGIGPLPAYFKVMRSLFRNKFCQFLFAGIHPRWTVRFAYNWSRHSRLNGYDPACDRAHPLLDNYMNFAKRYQLQHPDTDYYVFGHLHVLRDLPVSAPGDARLIVLGEWIKTNSYARFDGNTLTLHTFPS